MKGKSPSRYFFHNGTKYVLTGNERLAMSHFHELRAHLGLLKMTNVQKLPIIFGIKEFDDGTNASFQLIHGRETVNVFAPSYFDEEPKEVIRTVSEYEKKIVPVIRSTDDAYWIACLGGGFNGPYYAFKNINGITAEQLDDNNEYDLDKTLISTGEFPLPGTIGLPSLYFVAQTAKHVDFGLNKLTVERNEDYFVGTFNYLFEQYWRTIPWYSEYCVPNGTQNHWIIFVDVDFSTSQLIYSHFAYNGEEIFTPRSWRDIAIPVMSGPAVAGSSNHEESGSSGLLIDMQSFGGIITTNYDIHKKVMIRVNLELDDVTKGACCLSHMVATGSTTVSDPYEDCYDKLRTTLNYGDGPPNNVRTYYFHVDGDEFPFYETPTFGSVAVTSYTLTTFWDEWLESESEECTCEDNMLKYYGRDDSDGGTGIMCGRMGFSGQEACFQFMYNYAVAGRDADLITTLFLPENGINEHIIPGIDDTIRFEGKIFMGRITTFGKEKTIREV